MGTLEFGGKKFEITSEDYYTMMVATADRAAYCDDQMANAETDAGYRYWKREKVRAAALRLKLINNE